MNKWKDFSITDFADILNSQRIPLNAMQRAEKKGEYPYYGASGIIDYVDDFLFEGEHVLISEDGENLKSRKTPIAFKADGKFWVNNHAHILKGFEDHHNDLIVYYLKNLDLSPFLTGAVQPKLSKASLLSIPFNLPENELTQRRITSLLSSLDKKINLLQHQNRTMEQMAKTLFKQWFIVEAKEDWKDGVLGELVNIDTGFAFKSKEYTTEGNLKVIRGKNVTIGSIRWGDDSKYWDHDIEGLEKYLLNKWDIVIGMDGSRVGKNRSLVLEKDLPSILAQRVARLQAKNKDFQPFVWAIIYSNDFEAYVNSIQTGTSIPHISQSQIAEYEMIIPDEDTLINFCDVVNDFWKKAEYNSNQIHILGKLRDTLLPKLMSGDVTVSQDG